MTGLSQVMFIIFSFIAFCYLLAGLATSPSEGHSKTGTFLLAIVLTFYVIQKSLI